MHLVVKFIIIFQNSLRFAFPEKNASTEITKFLKKAYAIRYIHVKTQILYFSLEGTLTILTSKKI
jgi:hypothetical protein